MLGLYMLKAILKYRHGSLAVLHSKPWTCEASRNHEVPWIKSMRSQSRVFEKAVDFRAQIKDWKIERLKLWLRRINRGLLSFYGTLPQQYWRRSEPHLECRVPLWHRIGRMIMPLYKKRGGWTIRPASSLCFCLYPNQHVKMLIC